MPLCCLQLMRILNSQRPRPASPYIWGPTERPLSRSGPIVAGLGCAGQRAIETNRIRPPHSVPIGNPVRCAACAPHTGAIASNIWERSLIASNRIPSHVASLSPLLGFAAPSADHGPDRPGHDGHRSTSAPVAPRRPHSASHCRPARLLALSRPAGPRMIGPILPGERADLVRSLPSPVPSLVSLPWHVSRQTSSTITLNGSAAACSALTAPVRFSASARPLAGTSTGAGVPATKPLPNA